MKTLLIAAAALSASTFAVSAMPAASVSAPGGVAQVQYRDGGDTTVVRRRGPDGETTIIRRGDRGMREHRGWREETGSVERCRTVVVRKMDDRGNSVTRRIRRCS